MATFTTLLLARLIDGVSGPAQKAAQSLRSLKTAAGTAGGGIAGASTAAGSRWSALSQQFASNAKLARENFMHAQIHLLAAYEGVKMLGEIIEKPIEAAAQWQDALTKLSQRADITEHEAEHLGEAFREMSSSVAQSATDLAEAATVLPREILKDAHKAEEIMRVAARTSTAYGVDLKSTVQGALSTMNAWKISMHDLPLAFDMIASAAKDSKISITEFMSSLSTLGVNAASLGYSGPKALGDMAAAMDVIAKRSDNAQEAVGGLVKFVNKLFSAAGQKQLAKMGVNLRAVIDAANKKGASPLEAILQVLEKVTKGFQPELVGKIFGARGGGNVLKTLREHLKEIAEERARIFQARGTTERDFEKKMEDYEIAVKRLKVAFGNLRISLGTPLIPDATFAIKQLTRLIELVDHFATKHPQLVRAAAAIAAALGALSLAGAVGSFAMAGLKYAFWMLLSPLKLVLGLLGELAAGISIAGLLGFGAALVAAAVAAKFLWDNLEGIKAAFSAGSTAFFEKLGPQVKQVADDIKSLSETIGGSNWAIDISSWEKLGTLVGGALGTFVTDLAQGFEDSKEQIKIFIGWCEQARDIAVGIGSAFADMWATMKSDASNAAAEIKAFFTGGWKEIGQAAIDGLLAGFKSAWEGVKAWAAGAAASIKGMFKGATAGAAGAGGGGGGGGGAGSAPPARAAGGPVSAGKPYLVGERGWEIFTPRQSGTITPHGEAAAAGAAGGGSTTNAPTINFSPTININGGGGNDVDRRVRSVLREEVRELFRGSLSDVGLAAT